MPQPHFLLWLTLSLVMAQVDDMSYCSNRYGRLCQGKGIHVGCQFLYNGPGEACQNYTAILFTDELKQFILHYINRRRQRIAAGHERVRGGVHIPKPQVMMRVQWDRELAFLAQRLADQCEFVHDECRATVRYPFAGQTVGEVRWRRVGESMEIGARRSIGRVFDAWWGERRRVQVKQLTMPFKLTPRGAVWGHFSQLAVWTLRAMGCGAVRHGFYRPRLLLVCDFSHTNMLGQKTVSIGPVAMCPSNTIRIHTSRYPLLCSTARQSMSESPRYLYGRRDDGEGEDYDSEDTQDENEDWRTKPPGMRSYKPIRSEPEEAEFMEEQTRRIDAISTRRIEAISTRGGRPTDMSLRYRDAGELDKFNRELVERNTEQIRLKAAQKSRKDPSLWEVERKAEYKTVHDRNREWDTTRRLYQLWREYHDVDQVDMDSTVIPLKVIPIRKNIETLRQEVTSIELYRPTAHPINEKIVKQRWKRPRDRPRRPGANALLNSKNDLSLRKSASLVMDKEDEDQLFRDTGFRPSRSS